MKARGWRQKGGGCWILILWCKKIHVLKLYKTHGGVVDRLRIIKTTALYHFFNNSIIQHFLAREVIVL
jgi:hypothetical protein